MRYCSANDAIYNYIGVYSLLTRIVAKTDRSEMDNETHYDFITIIDRAQRIVRLEAEQAGIPIEAVVRRAA